MWFNILGGVASIVTIIGFLISVIKKDRRNTFLYIIILILGAITFYFFQCYKTKMNQQLCEERIREQIRMEAQEIKSSFPNFISYYEPGQNEGVLYSALIFLEKYKDRNPEAYEIYKENVIRKLDKAHNSHFDSERRELMEQAGKTAKQIIETLAR